MKRSGKSAERRSTPTAEECLLRAALEQAGSRFTRQRAAVFKFLRSVHTHPTAEDVYTCVRRSIPSISLATVYKCLEALVACRMASKLSPGDGPSRYDCRTDNHYHFRCLNTHQIRDLDLAHDPNLLQKLDPQLMDNLRKQGFHVTDYRLELVGTMEAGAS